MTIISNIDLRADPKAARHVKNETVEVIFAAEQGALRSREGRNSYTAGDALITGSTGDRWSVTRDRFYAKYLPVAPTRAGENGRYVNIPVPILALQMRQDFSIERSPGGDVIHGNAGDWLLEYAPGDHGIVEAAKFAKVYRASARATQPSSE
jgi:PGDYG protein